MERIKLSSCGCKLELEYPCRWVYKLIGHSEEVIHQAVAVVLQEREYLLTLSNESRSGKYLCVDVEVVVHNEDDRTANYEAFRRHPAIIMVL